MSKLTARGWNLLLAAARKAESAFDSLNWNDDPEAWRKAKLRKETAYAALRDALEAAEWGQSGSVFITDRADQIASPDRTRTLYINSRRVASCGDGWVALVDPARAEADYAERKECARAHDAAYKAERDLLIARLVVTGHDRLESFAEWTYSDGQHGGIFRREGTRIYVAAESALRAAEPLRSFVSATPADDEDDDFDHYAVRRRNRRGRR